MEGKAAQSNADTDIETKLTEASLDILDEEHKSSILRAVSNVLSTDIAEATYAQIIDGLPLISVLKDTYVGNNHLEREHPIYEHKELCSGSLEKTRSFRASFNPLSLLFESKLLFTFQAASPESRSFKTRLIEIIAVAVHQIAVLLFLADTSLHKDNKATLWTPPPQSVWWRFNPDGPLPTLFRHDWYIDHAQYPNGVADMVGYWAEGRILGGVVVFDRRARNSNAVFFHPDRYDFTYRIYKLLPGQKKQLLDFLLSKSLQQQSPLPILPSDENTTRIDPEEPIALTGVYRDIWERNLQSEHMGDARGRCVYDFLNYTSKKEFNESRGRYFSRYQRYLLDSLEGRSLVDDDSGDTARDESQGLFDISSKL